MQFTGKELASLMKMAFCIADADGKLEEGEKEVLKFGMQEFGLDNDACVTCIQVAQGMEVADAVGTLAAMDENQKKYACGYLAAVMASDGSLDKSEISMWQLICTMAQFPGMSFQDALDFWKNN